MQHRPVDKDILMVARRSVQKIPIIQNDGIYNYISFCFDILKLLAMPSGLHLGFYPHHTRVSCGKSNEGRIMIVN